MPDRRDLPWERPHERLEQMEHAEIRMLRWLINAEVVIGRLLIDLLDGQEKNMADLTALQAAVAELGSDSTADHDRILAAFGDLGAQIDDLKAQIAALQAGQIDQATVDALTATVASADAAFDDAANAVAPVVTPPAEPPVG